MRKTLRHTWIIGLLLVTLPWQPIYAIGYTRGEWEQIFRGQLETGLAVAYAMIAKNLTDGFVVLERELDSTVGAATTAELQMGALATRIAGGSSSDIAQYLREERQVLAAAQALGAQLDYLDTLFSRIKPLPQSLCGDEAMQRLSEDFRVSGALQVKGNLEQLNAQIKNVQEHGVDGGFQISISAPLGGGGSSGQTYSPPPRPDPHKEWKPGDGGATQSWYGNNDAWSTARFETTGSYGGWTEQDKQVQSAIVGGMTAIGATIGSIIPGLGTVLGGLIGSVIGGLICAIIFGNPKSKMVGELRDQISVILGVVDAISGEGIAPIGRKYCQKFVQAKATLDLTNDISARWPQRLAQARASLAAVNEQAKQIDEIYAEQLARLRDDVYPNLQKVIDQKFEACFDEIHQRSQESRKFAGEKLTAPLRTLLDAKADERQRVAAESAMWEAIVDGDARYAATKAFSFQPSSLSEGREVVSWDGLVRAVYGRLEGASK